MKKLLLLVSIFSVLTLAAERNATVLTGKKASEKVANSEIVRLKSFTNIPNYVKFKKGKEVPLVKLEAWLNQFYISDAKYGVKLIKKENGNLGFTHYRYQQTVNGIPVELSAFTAHVQNGLVVSVNGEFFSDINVASSPSLNESSALKKALNFINATTYKWEIKSEEAQLKEELEDLTATYYPQGELVLINNNGRIENKLKLAYKFNIYAQEPFSRRDVFIDANTGNVVWQQNKIHEADVTGTATTLYSGTQTITSDNSTGPFRLRESGRGNGIRTFSNGNTTNYSTADITNGSANWTTPDAALDAHWGAEMTYDYYLNQHSRNSIDGNGFTLISHVHHDDNYSNAFWDGNRMTYGDGSGNNSPFTALDIAGHEITHGLTSNTANLIYQDESGALNESFSDIFGVAVEFMARPAQANWVIGEDLGGTGIRNMQNPGLKGDPDTYFGTNWAPLGGGDNGGVHTNSGVQNFWFYLLTDGGSGTNDNGDGYTVNSLGITIAGQVAFRNLTVYLTQSSNYADARFYAIQSAVDLFGGCTSQVQEVTNAWHAVGVGPAYVANTVSNFDAPLASSCVAPFTVSFNNTSINGTTFIWDFGDGSPTVTTLNPTHTYSNNGNYTVQLIADGGVSCGMDTETKVSYINIDPSLPCITILPTAGTATTQTACTGTIFDSGGPAAKYGANEDVQITISPIGAATVDLTFVSFDVEAGSNNNCDFDFVEIYDGASTASTLIARYCNDNIPTTISSSTGSITVLFHSDGGLEEDGFELTWSCNLATQAPAANFTSNVDTTCTGEIFFTDISTNAPNAWSWNFGDGNTSTQQNPVHVYAANGFYTVTLNSQNTIGNDTEIKTNFVFVESPVAPSVNGDSICGSGTTSLSASGSGTLNWYTAATGGSIINTGGSYTTPVITTTTTYYVEDVIVAPTQNFGKTDDSGSGLDFNAQQHLFFDAYTAFELIDVTVYSSTAGLRIVELRNSLGSVLNSQVVNVTGTGAQVISLNFMITPGTDYQLGLAANTPNIELYRNNGSVNYPYTLNGVASITHSSANVNNGLDHYYFFYDWNVKEDDCISARTPVTAIIEICTGINDINEGSQVTTFLNSGNNLELNLTNLTQGDYNLFIVNALGQTVITEQVNVSSSKQTEIVNMNKVSKGLYFINLYNASSNYTTKLIK